MAISWDDLGFLIGKNLGGSIVDRMQNSDLRKARQDLEAYSGPSPDEINKVRDALFNQTKDAGVGIIGLTPQDIVSQQKSIYDKAQNNLTWAQNNGYGDASETQKWIQTMDAAHKNAEYARQLAQAKNVDMSGYGINDSLSNNQGILKNAVGASQAEEPQRGLLGNINFAPQYSTADKAPQGLVQSTLDKTAADTQQDYNRGNVITLDDIYKANGTSLDETTKTYAQQLAAARMKDPKYLDKLEDTLMSKGYDRNIINDVLKRASNVIDKTKAAEQEKLTNQAYADVMKIAQSGDTKALMAALPALLKATGAKASDVNSWAKNNQPEYKLDTTNTGGETIFTKYSSNGMGDAPVSHGVRNSLSPNTEYTGKVSMRNNDNNNATSQSIAAMKESGENGRLGTRLNFEGNLYANGYKGNKGSANKKIDKVHDVLDKSQSKVIQSISNGDFDSAGKYINEYGVTVEANRNKLDSEDYNYAQNMLYGMNALREYKAGNIEIAKKYASSLDDDMKQQLGINF